MAMKARTTIPGTVIGHPKVGCVDSAPGPLVPATHGRHHHAISGRSGRSDLSFAHVEPAAGLAAACPGWPFVQARGIGRGVGRGGTRWQA
jgi:hypothetical protein